MKKFEQRLLSRRRNLALDCRQKRLFFSSIRDITRNSRPYGWHLLESVCLHWRLTRKMHINLVSQRIVLFSMYVGKNWNFVYGFKSPNWKKEARIIKCSNLVYPKLQLNAIWNKKEMKYQIKWRGLTCRVSTAKVTARKEGHSGYKWTAMIMFKTEATTRCQKRFAYP